MMRIMRLLFITSIALLGFVVSSFASANFTGTWVLDLKASDSPEPMLKHMGVSALQRDLASTSTLQSTYNQSGNLLTITTRGLEFSRTEYLYLDGRTETKTEKSTGSYTIRTSWSKQGDRLMSTSVFRTKAGKNAELTVTRELADGGNTLVLSQTLKVEGEAPEPTIRRVWRRKS